jgi:hypothetical protein
VLLAALAAQCTMGDYSPKKHPAGTLRVEEYLPNHVIQSFQITTEGWEERIVAFWQDQAGMSKESAELEYLKLSQV